VFEEEVIAQGIPYTRTWSSPAISFSKLQPVTVNFEVVPAKAKAGETSVMDNLVPEQSYGEMKTKK